MIRRAAALGLLPLVAACSVGPDPTVEVRHYGSTRYWEGAQMRLFTFRPEEARSLDDRIRLARAEIDADPDCRWANAPREVIERATAEQGSSYMDTTLAAPVICG